MNIKNMFIDVGAFFWFHYHTCISNISLNLFLLFHNTKTIYYNPPWPAWGCIFHPIWFSDLRPGVQNVSC